MLPSPLTKFRQMDKHSKSRLAEAAMSQVSEKRHKRICDRSRKL